MPKIEINFNTFFPPDYIAIRLFQLIRVEYKNDMERKNRKNEWNTDADYSYV